jgi:hypothetical protein
MFTSAINHPPLVKVPVPDMPPRKSIEVFDWETSVPPLNIVLPSGPKRVEPPNITVPPLKLKDPEPDTSLKSHVVELEVGFI